MDQSSDSININARQWSASVLEVGPDCETTELLRRLTDDDYVVSTDWADAVQVLVNPGASSIPASAIQTATDAGTRQRLEVAVTGFANAFFEIPPHRRQVQWQALHHDCQPFPQLMRWLRNLEPALSTLRVPETSDESIDTFVNLCCQSFVAQGAERARRRQAIVQMYCQSPSIWQPVVKHLQVHHDAFVTVLVPWILKLQGIYQADVVKNNPLPVPAAATVTEPAKSENNWWGWFVALSIVSAIIRGIASNNGPPHPNLSGPIRPNFKGFTPGIRVEDVKDEALLRSARLATEILSGRYKPDRSLNETMNENAESVDEPPADALMPDQATSQE